MKLEKVTGRVYNIYHSINESVIQLTNGRIFICREQPLQYFIKEFVKFGMIITLHLKNERITQVDIKI